MSNDEQLRSVAEAAATRFVDAVKLITGRSLRDYETLKSVRILVAELFKAARSRECLEPSEHDDTMCPRCNCRAVLVDCVEVDVGVGVIRGNFTWECPICGTFAENRDYRTLDGGQPMSRFVFQDDVGTTREARELEYWRREQAKPVVNSTVRAKK